MFRGILVEDSLVELVACAEDEVPVAEPSCIVAHIARVVVVVESRRVYTD